MLKSKEEIESWLKKYDIKNYTINEDLTVEVNGDVDLSSKGLEKIPVKFSKINGAFICSHNKLTSLENCPETVNGSFFCQSNQLISLEYSPKNIKRNFACSNNNLITLKFCPKEIGGNFYCSENNLNSLEFLPKKIKGNLYIAYNPIKKEKLYLFDSNIEGDILSDFGNKEEFLNIVQEQKIVYEKNILDKILHKNNYILTKKRI